MRCALCALRVAFCICFFVLRFAFGVLRFAFFVAFCVCRVAFCVVRFAFCAFGFTFCVLLVAFCVFLLCVVCLVLFVLLALSVLWVLVLKSGVHATLAGVITAFFVPLKDRFGKSPLHSVEHGLAPYVLFGIVRLRKSRCIEKGRAGNSRPPLKASICVSRFSGTRRS